MKCENLCLNEDQICDGFLDCDDGLDEEQCRTYFPYLANYDLCQISELKCQDELKCFKFSELCNGFDDCVKKTDEQNCQQRNNSIIVQECDKKLSFICNDMKCIPIYQHCDGIHHCEDKSDEISCGKIFTIKHRFTTKNSRFLSQKIDF